MDNWNEMSLWQKVTDKDPSRPEKTWRSRIFWTWPITSFSETVSASRPRVERGTFPTSAGEVPCIKVRTSVYKGKTYKDLPLYHGRIFVWNGIGWGWK